MVQECYSQLLAEGYLASRAGSATRVADIGHTPADRLDPKRPPEQRVPVEPVSRAPASQVTGPRLIADFLPGVPDLSSFPRADWAWAVREACGGVASADLSYGDPRGSAVLREVLAGYLRRVRAAAADPSRMIVSTGFAQGINLVLRALAGQAGIRSVAFEDPGYGAAATDETIRATQAMGLRAVYVPVDDHGVSVSALAASGAHAVVVTPAHQSPTGVVLTAARRHALADWARRGGGFIIEDDYDSEFRYDKEPVGVLQGLAPDHVFLIGTASKALAPALRLGWVLAPPELAGAVAAQKEMSDRGSCTLDQVALATLLTSGRYDRHLRRMRTVYAARRAALVDAFTQHAPDVPLTGLAAGFHAVAHLPADASEAAVIVAARERGVGLHGITDYRGAPDTTAPPALVIGFGNTGERAIEPAIAAIADLLS
jgi:GntR family transcriptional regulator/MocR family aminotransferase